MAAAVQPRPVPYPRRRTCTSKVWHRSKTAAQQFEKRGRAARQNGDSHKLRPYRCPYCTGWHLTSKPETPGGS